MKAVVTHETVNTGPNQILELLVSTPVSSVSVRAPSEGRRNQMTTAINVLKFRFGLLRQTIESLSDKARDFLLNGPAALAGQIDTLLTARADD
jgi:hypothetical protein